MWFICNICTIQNHKNSIPMLVSEVCVYHCIVKIIEMFFTHSYWEEESNYCIISYVIMTPSVGLCCTISCQCSLIESEKLLMHACETTAERWGLGCQRHAELHLLWPSPRGLTLTESAADSGWHSELWGHWKPVEFIWVLAWVQEQ